MIARYQPMRNPRHRLGPRNRWYNRNKKNVSQLDTFIIGYIYKFSDLINKLNVIGFYFKTFS